MAEPGFLDLRSDLEFAAGSREGILQKWVAGLEQASVNIRYGAEVTQDQRLPGRLYDSVGQMAIRSARSTSCSRSAWRAIRASSARTAKTCERVQYQLDDPEEFRDETILVVGAGDSAIENALALAEQNDVWIVNRGKEFSRAKDANLAADGRGEQRPEHALALPVQNQTKEIRVGDGQTPLTVVLQTRGRATEIAVPIASSRASARFRRASSSSRRHQVSERAHRRHPRAVAPVRKQRARRVHHRLAGGLPADQAGDEPGLRRRRVHQRQRHSSRRIIRCSSTSSTACRSSATSTRWSSASRR